MDKRNCKQREPVLYYLERFALDWNHGTGDNHDATLKSMSCVARAYPIPEGAAIKSSLAVAVRAR